jgi:hypothetical protein
MKHTYDIAFYVKDGLGGYVGGVTTFHHSSDQVDDLLHIQVLNACVACWNDRQPWKIAQRHIDRLTIALCEGHEEATVICHWCGKEVDRLDADLVGVAASSSGKEADGLMYWCGCAQQEAPEETSEVHS